MQNNLFPVRFLFQFLNHRTTAYTPTISNSGNNTSPTGLAKLSSNSPVAPPVGRPVPEPSLSALAEEDGEEKPHPELEDDVTPLLPPEEKS